MEGGASGTGRGADSRSFVDPPPFEIEAGGQNLHFLPGGPERRQALFDVVRNAARSLKLCFYIYARDEVGSDLRDELVEAARRGVDVTIIVDSFGAEADAPFFASLVEAGGTFASFSPRLSMRYLIRNHQKMVIADGQMALIGGFNIEDSYFAPPGGRGWTDLAVGVEGSAVGGLTEWFDGLAEWVRTGRPSSRGTRVAVKVWEWRDGPVEWLVGGPTGRLSAWATRVRKDIERAGQLDMFMAYFSPSQSILRRIARIGRKGRARLVLAAKSDNNATIGAARSLYAPLLKGGVEIWEFQPTKLHTKLIVVDDAVYLGSANFDVRSLFINLEIMLRIEDAALAHRMRAFISQHAQFSERITARAHQRQATFWNRLRWNLGWLLVSVIDYNVSRRLNLGL